MECGSRFACEIKMFSEKIKFHAHAGNNNNEQNEKNNNNNKQPKQVSGDIVKNVYVCVRAR